ncbi:MAG: TIR domain-containing protein [Pyrinomonadaceae bacterium]
MDISPRRDQVFISYSHKDKNLFDKLQTALKPLVRGKTISVWDDTKIRPGDVWREEINQAIASAKVAVLLVSPDFLASDFIAKQELPPLLEAAGKDGLTILWIALRHSSYAETEIERYQAVNNPTRPLASLSPANREKELVRICGEIKAAACPPEEVKAASANEVIAGDTPKDGTPSAAAAARQDVRLTPPPEVDDGSPEDSGRENRDPVSSCARPEVLPHPEPEQLTMRRRRAMLFGAIGALLLLAVLISWTNVRPSAGSLPVALILMGLLVAVVVLLPFAVSLRWLTLTQPRQLRHRILIFVLGVFTLTAGLYLYARGANKDSVSEPTLRSYFAYITLTPIDPALAGSPSPAPSPAPKVPPNCHVTYHVALRFEVPEGQHAVYVDRIKTGGGGTDLDSNPSHAVRNPNHWPGNSTLLEFKIEEKQQPSRFLDIEAVAFLDTVVTRERAKVGPHLPYRAEFVVIVVDYSRMGFDPPPGDIWGQIELLGPDGVSRTETLNVVSHPAAKDGTVTLIGRNLPAESHILIRWGPRQ